MKDLYIDTRKYWNQYYDVKDRPETKKNEKVRTCNVSSVGMITGEHPNTVLEKLIGKYGDNDKFMWEEHLVSYLRECGFSCEEVTKLAWPKARRITDDELNKMKLEILGGKVILYHKKGHYQLMVGFDFADGEYFIFNDPAGNRNFKIKERSRKSGHRVKYSRTKIKREKIYGRCWSVTI